MNAVNDALRTVTYWLELGWGATLRLFSAMEASFHTLMTQLGVPRNIQTVLLLIADVLLIIVVLRLFGGAIRLLLLLFLILLVLHILTTGFNP